MTAQLTILASGSSGNASLLELDDFGLLIDGGLGPKQLATRLRLVGRSWDDVHAMILTHTHGDHWSLRTLQQMAHRRRPVYMHAGHQRNLQTSCPAIALLRAANVLRTYDHDQWLTLGPGLRCLPSEVQHDGGPTFGFRFEAGGDLFHKAWAAAYFCDLGCVDARVAELAADVDVLALEFNHDVELQKNSGRHPMLIARCLGDEGHLSNEQAAALLQHVLNHSRRGRLRHLVQLHLSRQCNRPSLARQAALAVIEPLAAEVAVHTASQHEPTPTLICDETSC